MPRKARIDAPAALHHVIVRGIEVKAIFKDRLIAAILSSDPAPSYQSLTPHVMPGC
jgi:hypothetical protein